MQKTVEALFPFFKAFNDTAKELFASKAKKVAIKKGSILFFQGEVCPGILYLTEGVVKVYIQGDEGNEITLYTVEPGEQCVINTSSCVANTPALGSAVTLEDSSGYMLDCRTIKELMALSPSYQEYMFSLFAIKLTSLATLVEDIKFKSLEQRIVALLESQEGKSLELTHERLAQKMGTSRVVVSRVLKKLQNSGAVDIKRGSISLIF